MSDLILCATHHRAFDAHLFTFDPDELVLVRRPGTDSDAPRLTRNSIADLERPPHWEALAWRLDRYMKRLGSTMGNPARISRTARRAQSDAAGQ